jgi:hypothetical protein
MSRFFCCLTLLTGGLAAGCKPESKPTVFESKHEGREHGHSHERGHEMLADFGPYHAGLTAHLSKKEGNELDVFFETGDDKNPKPFPLPLTQLTATASREGEEKTYTLDFEPSPQDERMDDPVGKCSRFTAKAPWMKHEDILTVTLRAPLEGHETTAVWTNFNPKKFAHADE